MRANTDPSFAMLERTKWYIARTQVSASAAIKWKNAVSVPY